MAKTAQDEGLVLKRYPHKDSAFCLFFKGELLPAQVSTSLNSDAHDLPHLTVTFLAATGDGVKVQSDQ